ncbi:MAG: Flp family type IVb pilin [Bryobacteraceae bacterium]|nr:Flp family type IVb pilin [Bryobacterales bacterium]MEB2362550.1 Flp family type IVb pilin [Bryobacterales bacterium]NUN03085.1 Flp family type IVb pilin [Bryobacteraceae bacterium]
MKRINSAVWKLRIWKDTRGQDLIEYALMAGFIAVMAAVAVPALTGQIESLFGRIGTALNGINP